MFKECKDAMQKVCWRKLDVMGKQGALLGSGWGLKAGSSKKSISSLVQCVREAVDGSSLPQEFWQCDEAECGLVVHHIWPLRSK